MTRFLKFSLDGSMVFAVALPASATDNLPGCSTPNQQRDPLCPPALLRATPSLALDRIQWRGREMPTHRCHD